MWDDRPRPQRPRAVPAHGVVRVDEIDRRAGFQSLEQRGLVEVGVSGTMEAKAYRQDKRHLLGAAVASYRRLEAECEWMIVEGAGSPAETNLRANDIANMGFAHAVNLPVVLVGDIERGHVIAALVGAHAVLDEADRARVRGFIINKFRGDAGLFAEGLATIEARTGWPSLGVAPWLAATQRLPAEDGMQIDRLAAGSRAHAGMVAGTGTASGRARVAILRPAPHCELRRLRTAGPRARYRACSGKSRRVAATRCSARCDPRQQDNHQRPPASACPGLGP